MVIRKEEEQQKKKKGKNVQMASQTHAVTLMTSQPVPKTGKISANNNNNNNAKGKKKIKKKKKKKKKEVKTEKRGKTKLILLKEAADF